MAEQHALIVMPAETVPEDAPAGPIETGLATALAELEAGGWVTAAHAHIVALARAAAQRADRLPLHEKAYAVAQVLTAAAKVYELLPTPDAVADTQWGEFMETLEKVGAQ